MVIYRCSKGEQKIKITEKQRSKQNGNGSKKRIGVIYDYCFGVSVYARARVYRVGTETKEKIV